MTAPANWGGQRIFRTVFPESAAAMETGFLLWKFRPVSMFWDVVPAGVRDDVKRICKTYGDDIATII